MYLLSRLSIEIFCKASLGSIIFSFKPLDLLEGLKRGILFLLFVFVLKNASKGTAFARYKNITKKSKSSAFIWYLLDLIPLSRSISKGPWKINQIYSLTDIHIINGVNFEHFWNFKDFYTNYIRPTFFDTVWSKRSHFKDNDLSYKTDTNCISKYSWIRWNKLYDIYMFTKQGPFVQGVPEISIRSKLPFSTHEGALGSKSQWPKASLMIYLHKGYDNFWLTLLILGRH